jgi:hypothetical protein
MVKKSFLTVGVCIAVCTVILGCDDSESQDDLYTLSSVVSDPVPVIVESDLGTIQFDLTQDPATNEQYEAFRSYLTSDPASINLLVINNESGVNFNLTEGTLVEAAPSGQGEYAISYVNEMVDVVFWNDFQGNTIVPGGDYSAYVSILDNDYFTTEEFIRSVSVQ